MSLMMTAGVDCSRLSIADATDVACTTAPAEMLRSETQPEDDFSDGSRVPADDRDGRTLSLARVPARQGGHGQQDAEQEHELAPEPRHAAGLAE